MVTAGRGPCDSCGRVLSYSINNKTRRLCKGCYDATRPKEPCADCGKLTVPNARTERGPLCARCRKREQAEECGGCGRVLPVVGRPEGRPLCDRCWRNTHTAECIQCGKTAPVGRQTADGAVCTRCRRRANYKQKPWRTCSGCGRTTRIALLEKNLCTTCAPKLREPEKCRDCGKVRPVVTRGESGPQCAVCWRRGRKEPCTSCGRVMTVIGRPAGKPYCRTCWWKHRPAEVMCQECGKYPPAATPAVDGVARCHGCYNAMQAQCARCGSLARVHRHWPEGPVCLACVDAVRYTHAGCSQCGQLRPVFRTGPHGAVCPECAGVAMSYTCRTCGSMGRIHGQGQCPACRALTVLNELLTPPEGRSSEWLAPLAEELVGYQNPYTMIHYIKGPGGRLIRRLVTGELGCTHAALDELRQTRSVEYLRGLLVLVGLLPPRDEELALARNQLQVRLAAVPHQEDRLLLTRWARWRLLPYLHKQPEHDGSENFSARTYVLAQFKTAAMFLAYLREQDMRLADCTQPVIDRWVSQQHWRRGHLRRFVSWAADQDLAPRHLDIANVTWADDRPVTSDDDRILLAVDLERDETVSVPDRIAGCLVLQYGQLTSRISRLTVDDVLRHPGQPGTLGLRLGTDPLWLRPRLSQLLARLIEDRTPHAAAGRSRQTPYLFPGGRPGRPIAPDTLSNRLNALGIRNRPARNGAILAMVGQIHWKVLGDLLGISDTAAQRWHVAAGGDRASYVASRLHRETPQSPLDATTRS